jgi:hypothetical protein
VDLQLCRALQRGHWTAELSVPGVPGRLSFPSLRALGHYIARLEAASADGAGEPDASERRREGPRP